MSVFKRRPTAKASSTPTAGPATSVRVSDDEAALATSEFNLNKITDIQNRFHGGAELLIPGRIFIREGTLVKMCRKGPKPRQFFLFNDILVYGIILPTKGRYAQQHILPLEHMSVTSDCHFMPSVYTAHTTELDEHVDTENAFQINHKDKSFHVFASSSSDKSNWIHNLRKHIAKQTQGKEDAGFAVRAVWVPDDRVNLCMVCRTKFSTFNRKHHCRNCGKVICGACSTHRLDLEVVKGARQQETKLERVCDECFKLLQASAPATASNLTNKPTVIDSRSATPAKDKQLTEAADVDQGENGALSKKKNRPTRPPPPSQTPERKHVLRVETFTKPPLSTATADPPRDSDTSSDSEDSAIIDLTDVDPADPFTMQRAESSSPLLGSEPLADICDRVQKQIRASLLLFEDGEAGKEATEREEPNSAEARVTKEEEKKETELQENGMPARAPRQKILGPKVLPDVSGISAKQRTATAEAVEAPVKKERKKKTVDTQVGEEQTLGAEAVEQSTGREENTEEGAKEEREESTTGSSKDVDALLSMTADEQPTSATSPLVTLATDPPGLSAEPLIPVSVQPTGNAPTAKRRTDRRKKQFKSSAAKSQASGGAEASVVTVAESAQVQEVPDQPSTLDGSSTTDGVTVESSQSVEEAEDIKKPEDNEELAETGDLVDVSEPQATATAEQTPAADNTPAETTKATSRADRRKNRFKKKTAD